MVGNRFGSRPVFSERRLQNIMRTNLKNRIAAVFCAAAAAFTSFTVLPTDAAEKKSPHITVLGDSLGTNYNLGSGEYGYSDYIADYLKAGTYSRFARNGYTTVNLLEQLESDSEVISAVKDSDLILVTVGSNDMLNALKEFVATNAEKGESFKDYALRVAKSGQQEAEDLTFKLNRALRTPRNDMLDNLKQIDKNLHEMNPDATVVFQKLYNPFESKTTVYNGKDYSEQYQTFIDYLRGHFKQINNGIENLTYGVVTDPYTLFRDHAWDYVFSEKEDIHPNTLGHAVMAAETLNKLGYTDAVVPQFEAVLHTLTSEVKADVPAETMKLVYQHAGFGDADGDGTITAYDATLILMDFSDMSIGYEEGDRTLTPEKEKIADVDLDGKINAFDAVLVLICSAQINAGFDDVTMHEIADSYIRK